MKQQSKISSDFNLNFLFPCSLWEHAVCLLGFGLSLKPKTFRAQRKSGSSKKVRMKFSESYLCCRFCCWAQTNPFVFLILLLRSPRGFPLHRRLPSLGTGGFCSCFYSPVKEGKFMTFCADINKKVNVSAMVRNRSVAGHATFWIETPSLYPFSFPAVFWPLSSQLACRQESPLFQPILAENFTHRIKRWRRNLSKYCLLSFPYWKTGAAWVCLCKAICILEILVFIFFCRTARPPWGAH